jgi:pimeloyl-ACP methyl ester carboxylesterase
MDYHGHGDSVTSDLATENEPYPVTAFRDIDLAMKYLQRELGVRRFVLMGHCAGAYFVFQSAAQHGFGGFIEAILINPNTFYWREDMILDQPQSQAFLAYQYSMLSVRKPNKWIKLLTGRSKIGIRGAMHHVTEFWKLRRRGASVRNDGGQTEFPSHPIANDLPGDLVRIEKKGRLLTLFQARTDPGYDILCSFAMAQVNKMCRAGQMSTFFFEKADHNFHWLGPRKELHDAVIAHFSARYPGVDAS